MKRIVILAMAVLLLLPGCGSKNAYKLQYESPYLSVTHSTLGEAYFIDRAGSLGEESLPVVLISNQRDYENFCMALEQRFSKETAELFVNHFQEIAQGLYTEDLFADWSVAVIYGSGQGNVSYIMEERKVAEGTLRMRFSRVVTQGESTKETGWLIPIWLTKVDLENISTLDACVADTYDRRYPLKVTQGEKDEKSILLDVETVADVAVKTYGLSKVEIDFAGEKKSLQTALKEGRITLQQLVIRARIDAAAGLCDMQQYNDGGTVVYIYEDYRLYKIKQFTASGTVEGDVWITAPDVELNQIK